jgi:hypothetical protein
MARMLTGIVLVLTALAAALFVGACAGTAATANTTAADYAGLWVDPQSNNEIWLHATTSGDALTLRWEREWETPVAQKATVRSDGTLVAAAVASDLDTNGELAYTGRLTSTGGLDLSTTTHVTGVDAAIPITIHFARGSQADYGAFATRMNKNLEQRRVGDAFMTALHTIGEGIAAWQDVHGLHKVPPVKSVRPGGAVDRALQAVGKTWPRLSDGSPVTTGTGRGQYIYRPLRRGYRLSGLAEDGQGPMSTGTTW